MSRNIPIEQWFQSREKEGIYRFHESVFEAYASTGGGEHWKHHTHKVSHSNYRDAIIETTAGDNYQVVALNQGEPEWT